MATASDYLRQAAAIPLQGSRVCLVTSSNGKRWVIPKGLIDPGQTAGEAALNEAWEEAGLVGELGPEPVGSYLRDKWGGTCHITVFLLRVTEVLNDWPERQARQRCWLSAARAVERIDNEALRLIMRAALDGEGAGT